MIAAVTAQYPALIIVVGLLCACSPSGSAEGPRARDTQVSRGDDGIHDGSSGADVRDAHDSGDKADSLPDGTSGRDMRSPSDMSAHADIQISLDGMSSHDSGRSDMLSRPDMETSADAVSLADRLMVADSGPNHDAAGGACGGADLRRDPDNCGNCGHRCSPGVSCLRGFCGRGALLRAVLPALRLVQE